MIVIFKNEQGTFSVRPAFIGFIKNDIIRRTLTSLFFPLILFLTIVINIIQAAFVSIILFARSVYYPLSKIKPMWKTDIWHRPRTKNDNKKTLN